MIACFVFALYLAVAGLLSLIGMVTLPLADVDSLIALLMLGVGLVGLAYFMSITLYKTFVKLTGSHDMQTRALWFAVRGYIVVLLYLQVALLLAGNGIATFPWGGPSAWS